MSRQGMLDGLMRQTRRIYLFMIVMVLLAGSWLWFRSTAEAARTQSRSDQIVARASRAMEQHHWGEAVALWRAVPAGHPRAAEAGRSQAIAERELRYEGHLAELSRQLEQGELVAAWRSYERLPSDTLSYREARGLLVRYIAPLAEAWRAHGVALARSQDLAGAQRAFQIASRLEPDVSPPPLVEPPEAPTPRVVARRARPVSSSSSPVALAQQRYRDGDLAGAIQALEALGTAPDQADPVAGELLDRLRWLRDLGDALDASSQDLESAWKHSLEVKGVTTIVDPESRSPATRALLVKAAEVGLRFGRQLVEQASTPGYRRAAACWLKALEFGGHTAELRAELDKLDSGPGAACYRPVLVQYQGNPVALDRAWAAGELKRCLAITPAGWPYHEKSLELLKQLED